MKIHFIVNNQQIITSSSDARFCLQRTPQDYPNTNQPFDNMSLLECVCEEIEELFTATINKNLAGFGGTTTLDDVCLYGEPDPKEFTISISEKKARKQLAERDGMPSISDAIKVLKVVR